MNIKAELDELQAQFFGPERAASLGKLGEIVTRASGGTVAERGEAMRELVARVDHEHVGYAAYLALAAGALVEAGESAVALGRALAVPLKRALINAARMFEYIAPFPDADEEADEDEEEHDHEHDDDEPDHDGFTIGSKWLTREQLDEIADRDVAAVQAWFSLEMWYRPAVAAWTREPEVLRAHQADAAMRAAIAELGGATETSAWLTLLIETLYDAKLVFLVPELGEAWSVIADGVVDIGQLSVLVSQALADPLARIGASVAGEDIRSVMSGEGPQQSDAAYECTFHCYPAQAVGADGMPRDDVYEWSAPGGTGTHSLPPDFLPGTIEAIDGARLLVLVGPRSPGMRFSRVISAVRTFDALAASVRSPTRLPADQVARWASLARDRAV